MIVEGVFAYPGIGGLALDAVAARDIPLVEAFVWVVAVMILVVNLLTDALATLLDPRLREDGLDARQRRIMSSVRVPYRQSTPRR